MEFNRYLGEIGESIKRKTRPSSRVKALGAISLSLVLNGCGYKADGGELLIPTPTTAPSYSVTALEQMCKEGTDPIDIYIWPHQELNFVLSYINGSIRHCKPETIITIVKYDGTDVSTGDVIGNRRIIRYHY